MPKNKVGGKKHRGKKNTIKESKELIIPEKNELIGQVTATKGNGRFDIKCIDNLIVLSASCDFLSFAHTMLCTR